MKYYETTFIFSNELNQTCDLCGSRCSSLHTQDPFLIHSPVVCIRCKLCMCAWHNDRELKKEPCKNCLLYGSINTTSHESYVGKCQECIKNKDYYGIDDIFMDDYTKYLTFFNTDLNKTELDPRVRYFLIRANIARYCAVFNEEEIMYEDLINFSEDDLQAIFQNNNVNVQKFKNSLQKEISILSSSNDELNDIHCNIHMTESNDVQRPSNIPFENNESEKSEENEYEEVVEEESESESEESESENEECKESESEESEYENEECEEKDEKCNEEKDEESEEYSYEDEESEYEYEYSYEDEGSEYSYEYEDEESEENEYEDAESEENEYEYEDEESEENEYEYEDEESEESEENEYEYEDEESEESEYEDEENEENEEKDEETEYEYENEENEEKKIYIVNETSSSEYERDKNKNLIGIKLAYSFHYRF